MNETFKVHVTPSFNCSAFVAPTIGTKVVHRGHFLAKLLPAIREHDTTKDRAPGQHFIMLDSAVPYVSGGVGARSQNPDDYIVRVYREGPKLFLKRSLAAPVTSCAAVVYTREAYLKDPDVSSKEAAHFQEHDYYTHVIVAVLAGDAPQLSPYRFVHNLAGGNNEAALYTADEIRTMARAIKDYADRWCTVAD